MVRYLYRPNSNFITPMMLRHICHKKVNSYSIFRYVVFYLPFDVGYKALKFMPVRLMCEALKEVYRAKMVHDGVSHAAKLFPNAYIVMVSCSWSTFSWSKYPILKKYAQVWFIIYNFKHFLDYHWDNKRKWRGFYESWPAACSWRLGTWSNRVP